MSYHIDLLAIINYSFYSLNIVKNQIINPDLLYIVVRKQEKSLSLQACSKHRQQFLRKTLTFYQLKTHALNFLSSVEKISTDQEVIDRPL